VIVPVGAPAPRADRPASAVLHDEPDARIVCFVLAPGQRIPPHHSDSTVIVQVIEGTGVFRGADSEATLGAGQLAVFAPGESHGIEAGAAPLRFTAVIAPRPRA
jgi:quercetin dioxygenase-like cupin family protein